MLIILCGLIGSGKTTYAFGNYTHFTDLDLLPKFANKKAQIDNTFRLLNHHSLVCHITTYPTEEEVAAFSRVKNKEYVWLDTSIDQAKVNILIRNRNRDMKNLPGVFAANEEYNENYKNSNLSFKRVKVFK